jgi:hypothetical protein
MPFRLEPKANSYLGGVAGVVALGPVLVVGLVSPQPTAVKTTSASTKKPITFFTATILSGNENQNR